jgi:hypothetical protein
MNTPMNEEGLQIVSDGMEVEFFDGINGSVLV